MSVSQSIACTLVSELSDTAHFQVSLGGKKGKGGGGGGRVRCIGMEENANRRWCSTY